MAPGTRPRSPRGEGERLHDEILAAAEQLLVDTGSEAAVSIRAVADAVGVTPPSIYRHFQDKDQLLAEVVGRHFAALDAFIEDAVHGLDDPIDAMVARGRAYVRFGLEHPEHYRLMFMSRTTGYKGEDVLEAGAFGHLVQGLRAAIDAGEIDDPGDVHRAALHVWANVHGLTSLLIAKPMFPWPDLDELIDEHLAYCLVARVTDR